jgi:3-oxoacyl-[acyl-carrier-protein] synthase-3
MSGIRERRFWPKGMAASERSIESGEMAIQKSGIDRTQIGALLHASVTRDYLEPATACRVHDQLKLPAECQVYDLSNACLGMLNGMLQVANMIELGQIEAGLVVGTESGRSLVETTVDWLNRSETLTRDNIKLAVASLTIGSASSAVLLTHERISKTGHRLVGGAARSDSVHHTLCHGNHTSGDGAMLMTTDSEQLMREGIETGRQTFAAFLEETQWSREQIAQSFCHQIGSAHRKMMLQTLGLPLEKDFTTFEWLGNTGSAALPVTMALGLEQGKVAGGDKVVMLGIGSGINCIMLGVEIGARV